MTQNRVLIAAAVLGIAIAIGAIILGNRQFISPPPAVPATQAPYASFIAGAGLIESDTENIAIGTPVAGIVSKIYVKIGGHVEKGAPLFKIDDRDLQSRLLPAQARVTEAEAILEKSKIDLQIAENLENKLAIKKKELYDRRADVVIAEAALETAKAVVGQINIEIDRRTIRAPVGGKILQIKTHLGELAQARTSGKPPLMMLGGDSVLHVRVDIDEFDAWRFQSDQPATAFVRGEPSVKIPLTFVRTEPYIIPKKSLTGNGAERSDTRVLQVIYSFDPRGASLYIGQQMDVYIKAVPAGGA